MPFVSFHRKQTHLTWKGWSFNAYSTALVDFSTAFYIALKTIEYWMKMVFRTERLHAWYQLLILLLSKEPEEQCNIVIWNVIGDDKEKEKLCKFVNAIMLRFDKRLSSILFCNFLKLTRQEWFSKRSNNCLPRQSPYHRSSVLKTILLRTFLSSCVLVHLVISCHVRITLIYRGDPISSSPQWRIPTRQPRWSSPVWGTQLFRRSLKNPESRMTASFLWWTAGDLKSD